MEAVEIKVVGLTGGIACGKSEVAKAFQELGASIIDADLLAREVVAPGTEGLAEVVKLFGSSITSPLGDLNRKALGEIVFREPAKRELLEQALHPRIRALFRERLKEARALHPEKVVVYVVPLLFESKEPYPEIQVTVVVSSPDEVAASRLMAREGIDRPLAEAKIRAQLPIDEKERRADFVIRNSGTVQDLRREAEKVYRSLLSFTRP